MKVYVCWQGLPILSDLNLSATKVTDRGLPLLLTHQPMWKLVLLNTNVTDSGMNSVAKLKNLECLDLDSTAVTIVGLKFFKCAKLRTLNVQNCRFNATRMPPSCTDCCRNYQPRCFAYAADCSRLAQLGKITPAKPVDNQSLACDFEAKINAFKAISPDCEVINVLP